MSNESTGTVSTIFEEVSLLPKGRCVIGGREFELEAIRLLLGQAKDVAPNVVAVSALSFIIYANYYSKFDLVTFLESPSRGRDLTAELQRHNHGRKELQPGWSVEMVNPDGSIVATRYGTTRLFQTSEYCIHSRQRIDQMRGQEIEVIFWHHQTNFQRDFYHATFLNEEDVSDQRQLVRTYWNVAFDGSCLLLEYVSERFRKFQIPYRLKIANSTATFPRCDCTVLMFPQRFYGLAAKLIAEVAPRIAPHVRGIPPAFTKKLVPGLGLAEDPGTGESFGLNRCQLIAEAIWMAYVAGKQDETSRDLALRNLLSSNQSASKLFLVRSKSDIYAFPE